MRVVQLAGIGPGPFCGMMLADHGAEVIRVERPRPGSLPVPDLTVRGRRSLVLDLKVPEAVEVVLRLVSTADALIEGFRPGVADRLGLGPEVCMKRNERLVYCRITGWGQEGPLASSAGHDIDYIALSGALWSIGRADAPPPPPLNLIGDYGGGGMLAAFGVVAGVLSARQRGAGCVIDAAMVDGVSLLMTPMFELLGSGWWLDARESNLLDGHAPFYDTYETADGKYMAVGALEPEFYRELVQRLGLDSGTLPDQMDPSGWPELRRRFVETFKVKTRAEWEAVFEGSDACVTPVLSLTEVPHHPHHVERSTFLPGATGYEPGPAPRFAGTERRLPGRGADETLSILKELGYQGPEVDRLRHAGAIPTAGDQEDEIP